ncbi:MAG TPA: hypothetical protein DGT23_27530 [Micromonosporaceae bacterium]|nr:hypothetical protein [Micromonosporaceae bacterium]
MGRAVVVGAGFSGVLAARELLRVGWSVVLIDPGARPGRGLAYGTSAPWHLLNSPVSAMSVEPDLPDDFLHWCRRWDARVEPTDFVPRSWYGEYLTDALLGADTIAPGELIVHRGRVVRIFATSPTTNTVLLADDVVISADIAVLAVGNSQPDERFQVDPGARGTQAYVRDPWAPGALESLPEGKVLLIGTGLTAIDVVLTLAQSGRHPHITAVSRHGLLPEPHRPTQKITLEAPQSTSLAGLMRAIRTKVKETGDWRAVMDGLRPHWNAMWQRLAPVDQQRFLRHLARHWEVHRHRMAPPIAAAVGGLRDDGVLSIKTAELCGITAEPSGSLRAVLKSSKIDSGEYQAIVNCTGPGQLIKADPLVRSLVADGLAQPGPYGLGLDVDEHGALRGRSQRPPSIYTLGPPRRGHLWETTAAPEIRAQARALAIHLIPPTSASRDLGALGSCRADSAYPLPG